jgi:hypothetical protein
MLEWRIVTSRRVLATILFNYFVELTPWLTLLEWRSSPAASIWFAFGYCLFVLALVAVGEWTGLIH